MRILLSNDDGILAPGLCRLAAAVRDLGTVSVVAPDSPQSASAHAITLLEPLVVRTVELPDMEGVLGQSVSGRPADCVRLAIRNLLDQPPTLVLSGINRGANIGINIFYSGTVAAAAEGAMLGFPAVAFSVEIPSDGSEPDYGRAACYCRRILDILLADGLTRGDLVNVNIPDLTRRQPRGVRVTPQSTAGVEVEDEYILQARSGQERSYRIGDKYELRHQDHTDVAYLAEGYITITPLHIDMTNHDRLASLAHKDWTLDGHDFA